MDSKELHRAAEEAKNFPAAHSMDSGWFAVDDEGHVAHFDTGEGGAMPASAKLVTGEASARGEDGWEFVMPWLARQRGKSTEGLDLAAPFCAAFENSETAEAAVTLFAEASSIGKARIVEFYADPIEATLHERVSKMPGFIGFAPTYDDVFEDDTLSERYPILFYAHGSWEIPGEYVRRSDAVTKPSTDPELLERAEHMATNFAARETIQLADFYGNDECDSWSQADLRSGELPEKAQRPQAQQGEIRRVIFFVVAFLLLVWFVFWMKG